MSILTLTHSTPRERKILKFMAIAGVILMIVGYVGNETYNRDIFLALIIIGFLSALLGGRCFFKSIILDERISKEKKKR